MKFRPGKFLVGSPTTISVTSASGFKPGDFFWYDDARWRVVGVDETSLSIVMALTLKQRIARRLIKILEWSPRQRALDRLYQAQGEPGQAHGRYGRSTGRYDRGM